MAIQPIHPYEMDISNNEFDEIMKKINNNLIFREKGLQSYIVKQEINGANVRLCDRIRYLFVEAGWETMCFCNVSDSKQILTLKIAHKRL